MDDLQRVLLVEDHAHIRAIVKVALEKLGGLTVCACASGADALKTVGDFCPQLILLDVMMPGMDGPTLLGHLRERPDTAQIPIVFLTARTTAQEIKSLRDSGALDVIPKPFDPITLHVIVKSIWAGLEPAQRTP